MSTSDDEQGTHWIEVPKNHRDPRLFGHLFCTFNRASEMQTSAHFLDVIISFFLTITKGKPLRSSNAVMK